MSLQTLPNDILLDILDYVSSWTNDKYGDFKQRLYLLTLFQQLRAIALPKVYDYMYIYYNENKNYHRQNNVNKYSKTFAARINTNADIIALANVTHMIKSTNIYIGYTFGYGSPFTDMHKVFDALNSCANVWPNITNLRMHISYNIKTRDLIENPSIKYCPLTKEYSRQLTNIMPGVTELRLSNAYDDDDIGDFYSRVTGAYSDQLETFISRRSYTCLSSYKFEVVQYFWLAMGLDVTVLPCVNAHTLVDLHIYNMPYNVSWAPFMDSTDDTVVEFSSLKKLWLHFGSNMVTGNDDVNKPDIVLKFPGLSLLDIIIESELCTFFKMAKLPDTMDNIYIKAPRSTIRELGNTKMPSAKKTTKEYSIR